MRACSLYLGVVYLALTALHAPAADLSKIERSIAREPAYKGAPSYCLLVFGPEAKFRVWLVLDGNDLYVDRDGTGDLTTAGKRVTSQSNKGDLIGFKPGQLTAPDGTKYDLSQLRKRKDGCDISLALKQGYSRAGQDGPGALCFAARPADAPIIHFLGPLTLQAFEPHTCSASANLTQGPLVRGETSGLAFSVGTPGLGAGTFAKYPLNDEVNATAEVRFAKRDPVSITLAPDD
jgi:hypothetical protein